MKATITTPFPSNFTANIRITHSDKGFKGTLYHKEVGVKDYKTDLDPDETQLVLSIVSRASGNEILFDPEPKNLLKDFKGALEKLKQQESRDAETLDKQEARISELETELSNVRQAHEIEMQAAKRASENAVSRIKELTEELKAERAKDPTDPPPASVKQPTTEVINPKPTETSTTEAADKTEVPNA